ncbi:MAG: acyltransferase family protein [Acidobacteriaceae bacterium]
MAVSLLVESPSVVPSEPKPVKAKKERLPALSGLRILAALNIVFFHYSNPKWFGPFAPIVANGYTSVSFFLMMSGFILAYNYEERARAGKLKAKNFWIARFSRLYPVYMLALVVSLGMLADEWHARTHAQFALGMVLTPLMLQGWSPSLSTFWNTPAWTMCTEAFFYMIFPVVILLRRPQRLSRLFLWMLGLWAAGMVLPSLYMYFHPDGVMHVNRYTNGFWIRALKFTPPPHVPSFMFGIALADLDRRIRRDARIRLWMGLAGCAAVYTVLYYGDSMPFPMMHDGLLMPLFGLAILGLAGHNFLAKIFGWFPFAVAGQASYCLYILHFNLWILIHRWHVWNDLGLARFDPWISYATLVLVAVLVMFFFEKPMQKYIRHKFLPSYERS